MTTTTARTDPKQDPGKIAARKRANMFRSMALSVLKSRAGRLEAELTLEEIADRMKNPKLTDALRGDLEGKAAETRMFSFIVDTTSRMNTAAIGKTLKSDDEVKTVQKELKRIHSLSGGIRRSIDTVKAFAFGTVVGTGLHMLFNLGHIAERIGSIMASAVALGAIVALITYTTRYLNKTYREIERRMREGIKKDADEIAERHKNPDAPIAVAVPMGDLLTAARHACTQCGKCKPPEPGTYAAPGSDMLN